MSFPWSESTEAENRNKEMDAQAAAAGVGHKHTEMMQIHSIKLILAQNAHV